MKTVQKVFSLILISSALLFAVAPTANANTVIRTGETVAVTEEQTIDGDFYSTAGDVDISGTVTEDLVVAAGKVTLNGTIGDNAFLLAGTADIHGNIKDDLRIIAGEVTIGEPIQGDLLVIAGKVNLLSTASVTGDMIIYANDATIKGSVGGDIIGAIGTLDIDGTVSGDVNVTVENISLGDRAYIEGSVQHVSTKLAERAPNAHVTGSISRNDPTFLGSQTDIKNILLPVLALLFSILVWHLVSRKSLTIVISRTLVKSPKPVLYGLVTLLATPFIFTLLFISIIGAPVGGILLLTYILLILLGTLAVPAVLGQFFMSAFNQGSKKPSLVSIVAGTVGVALLLLLPVIGQIILLILTVTAIGALVDFLYHPSRDS